MSFEHLGLKKALLNAVADMGFTEPTPIQHQTISAILAGNRDIVGLAQTGTGKTASFGLPMMQLTDFDRQATTGLVLCPTRELCLQISKDFRAYSSYIKGAKIVSIYGGASYSTQIRDLKKGAPIIVATPGRLMDLMQRNIVDLSSLSCVVLDEADEMLNMGFQEDIDNILKDTPREKTTWLFSATMPKSVAKIAAQYMHDPFEITVGHKNAVARNIDHSYVLVREKDRYAALKRLIDAHPDIFGLIFCRTRNETAEVAEKLIADGYKAEALHGDLSQARRDEVMHRFRKKHIQLLAATDVAARGLDVNDISHIIHFRLPDDTENYTHRSGRTARAGKSGKSITLINIKEKGKLAHIEKKTNIRMRHDPIPNGDDILEKHLAAASDKLIGDIPHSPAIDRFLPQICEQLSTLSREDLVKRVISKECGRFLRDYENAEDLNLPTKKRGAKSGKQMEGKPSGKPPKARKPNLGNKRFFINVGEMDKIQKGSITKLVCSYTGLPSRMLGKIEIYRSFSFFEIANIPPKEVLSSLKHAKLDGRKVSVEYADKKPMRHRRSGKRR